MLTYQGHADPHPCSVGCRCTKSVRGGELWVATSGHCLSFVLRCYMFLVYMLHSLLAFRILVYVLCFTFNRSMPCIKTRTSRVGSKFGI